LISSEKLYNTFYSYYLNYFTNSGLTFNDILFNDAASIDRIAAGLPSNIIDTDDTSKLPLENIDSYEGDIELDDDGVHHHHHHTHYIDDLVEYLKSHRIYENHHHYHHFHHHYPLISNKRDINWLNSIFKSENYPKITTSNYLLNRLYDSHLIDSKNFYDNPLFYTNTQLPSHHVTHHFYDYEYDPIYDRYHHHHHHHHYIFNNKNPLNSLTTLGYPYYYNDYIQHHHHHHHHHHHYNGYIPHQNYFIHYYDSNGHLITRNNNNYPLFNKSPYENELTLRNRLKYYYYYDLPIPKYLLDAYETNANVYSDPS
jgi:hypothetical protein